MLSFLTKFAQFSSDTTFAEGNCQAGSGISLSIPTWYKYLNCNLDGTVIINGGGDVWKIVAGIVDILIWLAAVMAVFFIIYSGIRFIISLGQPDKINQARQMLIYASAGFILAIIARVAVQFVFNMFL
jgi:hypothetical protein